MNGLPPCSNLSPWSSFFEEALRLCEVAKAREAEGANESIKKPARLGRGGTGLGNSARALRGAGAGRADRYCHDTTAAADIAPQLNTNTGR